MHIEIYFYIFGIYFNIEISMNTSTTKTIARINQVDILLIENGEKRVAIKPICEALGVDFSAQLQKLKSDPILGSTMGLITTVGADGKEREMQTIPFKYVFGWLFRIDSRNVKEEAREVVLKYQNECYDVLYRHFTAQAEFIEKKQVLVENQLTKFQEARRAYNEAHKNMKAIEKELDKARQLIFDDYDAENRQMKIEFAEEVEEISEQ